MAIVVITVIGIAVGGALSYAGTSLKASNQAYEPARDQLYAADAAAKTAIAYLRLNPAAGEATPDGSCRALPYGTVGTAPVTVDVCPNTSTSFSPLGGRPKYTLVTLGTGETGVEITSSGTFYVAGNVYSNTDIAAKGTLAVIGGDVRARSGCNGTIAVDGANTVDCALASQPADAVDPAYAPAVQGAPPAATGMCDTGTRIATLGPGTWSSAAAIDAAIGSCSFVQMLPGVHYLDDFASNAPWTIRTKVVAGTLNGNIATSPIPGGCVINAAGAQIVMGGTSQISMGSGGSLQVCGIATTQNGSTIHVPLYGPTRDWTAATTNVLTGSAATSSTFTPVADGLVIDGRSASYSVPTRNGTATYSVTGIGAAGVIPAGTPVSVVVAASAATAANLDESVVVTSADGTTCAKTLTIGTTMPTSANATAVLLDCPGFTGQAPMQADVKVTNTRKNGGGNLVLIDGVELRHDTAGAPIKRQAGCIVTPGGCDVLSTNGTGRDVWLAGVVYVPLASIDLKVPNSSTAVITQALVVRSLSVNATASAQTDPIVGSDRGERANGDVTVNANVAGTPWVSTRATFTVTGGVITPSIQSWVVRR